MNEELLEQFLIEGREQAALADQSLSRLRLSPSDGEALAACFRAIHTLKGSAGLLSLTPMAALLHTAEDLLAALRTRPPAAGELEFLSETVDQTDRWLEALAASGRLPGDAEASLARLVGGDGRAQLAAGPGQGQVVIRYTPRSDAYFAGDDPVEIVRQVPQLSQLRISLREPWDPAADYDPFDCNLQIEAVSDAPLHEVAAAFRLVSDQVVLTSQAAPAKAPVPELAEPAAALRTVRIDIAHVERLAAVIDELVVANGDLESLAGEAERLPGGASLARSIRDQQAAQDRLATGLHAALGRLRLAPLSPLFARFPRRVREIAQDLGKSVEFETDAGGVDLDRSLADGLFEPLLHVLRNAIDHGVEAPELRRAAGKSEQATVRLLAQAQGDRVAITVEDDGAGLDASRLREAAVARGLLAAPQAEALSEAQAMDLIFLPGLSTRESATELSGRGVGMDAVRRAVDRLGGEVTVASRPGAGTQVRFLLPVALKLSRILIVRCGAERYGLDLAEVLEAVRLAPGDLTPIRAGVGFVWRDRPVPLLSLAKLTGLAPAAHAETTNVIVLKTRQGPVGLSVEAIGDRIQAVVRPPAGLLAALPVVTGVTLLRDGGALLILSPEELARWA